MELHTKTTKSIQTLVELGTKGFFPLFPKPWLDKVLSGSKLQLTSKEKLKARKLMHQVLEYRTLERKRTALCDLEEADRELFIKAFLLLVETSILDAGPELQ